MPKAIAITDAEAVVMEVLWREAGPISTEQVVLSLARVQDWQEATIKTLLNRLLKKGAVSADKDGRRYRYSPVLRREDWVHGESRGLLDRVFDGRLAPLVAHFSEKGRLGKKDIAELKRLIGELDNDG